MSNLLDNRYYVRPEGVEGKSWPIECGSAEEAACKFVEFYEIGKGSFEVAEGDESMVVEVMEGGGWIRFEVRGTLAPEYIVGG